MGWFEKNRPHFRALKSARHDRGLLQTLLGLKDDLLASLLTNDLTERSHLIFKGIPS